MPLSDEGRSGYIGRRGFVQVIAATALGAVLPGCSEEQQALGFRPEAKRQTPFITPNGDFYLVAVDPDFRPALNVHNVESDWALELFGLDGNAHRLGYGGLYEEARRRVHYTFECIGNRVGGQLIGNAEWHVVPLKEVLARAAGGTRGAEAVMFEGLDEFYSSVSIARAMDDYAFLALRMNGEMLPAGHGFPARVILPDLYGMKQPRWLRRIRLLRAPDTTSYWEKRGWAGEVPVKTMSRLDPPPQETAAGTPMDLTGIAFGGARGISAVQVSLDGGRNWVPCELTSGERPHVWSLWHYRWERPSAGRHELLVRAADGTGEWQTAERQRAFPDGASGYDRAELAIGERPQ